MSIASVVSNRDLLDCIVRTIPVSADGLERLRRINAVCKLWCRAARPVIKEFLSNPRHFFHSEELLAAKIRRDKLRKKREEREQFEYENSRFEAEDAEAVSKAMAILTETMNRSLQVLWLRAPGL